jgi:hypothetical protein
MTHESRRVRCECGARMAGLRILERRIWPEL